MNLRCTYCQTPFTVGRAELLAALQRMDAEKLHHYDAHCPRCRKANSVARQRMEMFFPNWRQVAQEQASTPAAPAPATENDEGPAPKKPVAETEKKPTSAPSKPKAKPVTASSSKGKKTVAKSKK
jgi:hypothetical protein